ncbi:MAG: hypothetical protein K9G58_15070 [Bacteroidales bacterium]|nr:hypothetical protein [Bacteroidales bacterium]
MGEKRDTYLDELDNLPVHNAPGHVWERLQASMFSIDHSILPEHYPPASLWKRIERSKRKQFVFGHFKRIALALLILLALGIPAYYLLDRDENIHSIQNENIHLESSKNATTNSLFENRNEKEIINLFAGMKPHHLSIQEEERLNLMSNIQPRNKAVWNIRRQMATAPIFSVESRQSYLQMPGNCLSLKQGNDPVDCSPFESDQRFGIGLSYDYQFFNQEASYMNSDLSYWQSLNFDTRFQINKFYVQTGVGATFSRDKIQWEYEYLRKELVDSYIYVDSVYYNPQTGETYYYTSIVEVYDSISHNARETSYKKQYYFRLPVVAGYQIYDSRDFALGIQGGLVYNMLVGARELKFEPYEPGSRVTKVYFHRTKRLEHNFNLAAGLNFTWKANRKLHFHVFPSVNYYFDHIYQQAGGNLPLTFGIGLGVQFR